MSAPIISVSAVLLSYNCEEFISEALWSVLDQDYRPLDVLVSDDGSRDQTVSVIERELARYAGPHHIRLNRRAHNTGSKAAHLNDVFPDLEGDVIVLFDGDDISSSHRVSRLVEVFRDREEARAVYSAMSIIDRFGHPMRRSPVPHPARGDNAARWFAQVDSYAAGGTLGIHRSVIDSFGALDPGIHEDVVLPFRASLLGAVVFVDEPLVTVRRHASSFTASLEQFQSLECYRERVEAGIAKASRKAALRLADIAAAQQLLPGQGNELEELRRIVDASLSQARTTRGLVSPSRRVRLAALVELVKAKAYPEELAQHLFLALAPSLYLRYKRHMVARKIH